MPIDYDALKNWQFGDIEQTYTEKDCILYALGLGYGSDPVDPGHLKYLYEAGLEAFPTMPVVMASPGFWLIDPATGVDWKKVVAAEQGITIHRPLPVAGRLIGRMRVTEIYDKGPAKGVLLAYCRDIHDGATGALLCSVEGSSFLRGDGGFGGTAVAPPPPPSAPHRAPDGATDIATLPQAALIYRLSGDYNPLHADPAVARHAGFSRPILHGLCTFGIACRGVLDFLGPGASIRHFSGRFSSPVYPGETIRTEIWRLDGGSLAFRCSIPARDAVVLSNGLVRLALA